jgi:hypothetical protein
MHRWSFVLLPLMLLGSGNAIAEQNGAAKVLHDLFAAEWDYDTQQSPESASELGDRRWNDRWSDDSLEAYARRNQHK